MALPIFPSILGTMQALFHIGGPSAPALKNNAGAVQVRDSTDAAHADFEAKSLKAHGTNITTGVKLAAPGGMGASITLTLPSTVGSPGQNLQTDGAGGLGWGYSQPNADLTDTTNFTQASASPLAMFTPPANALLREVGVLVSSPAAGGSPTISIGTASQPALYAATSDIDLKAAGLYVIPVYADVGATPDPIIATIVANGQTFTGQIYAVFTNPV